eukprot:12919467-Alexandrium_andersonii.AAC.1
MAVLSASKASGLVVDLHHCRGAMVEAVAEEKVLALSRLQCRVAQCGHSWEVTGWSWAGPWNSSFGLSALARSSAPS